MAYSDRNRIQKTLFSYQRQSVRELLWTRQTGYTLYLRRSNLVLPEDVTVALLPMNNRPGRTVGLGDPVKVATINALERVLDPLLELMLDAGVTVPELNRVARDRAVRGAAKRIKKEIGRESKSRVAILTGLSRSEVGRILRSEDSASAQKPDQHRARRVLAEWHESSAYLAPNGLPAALPIFGKTRSFQNLVERYGGGIPVRAMLDELTRLNVVEQIKGMKVRAVARTPIQTSLTSRSIAALGERAGEFLGTLTHNVRYASHPMFEATALIADADMDMTSLARQVIAERGRKFIKDADTLLNRPRTRTKQKHLGNSETCRLGVTVYFFQDQTEVEKTLTGKSRKNLRRKQARPAK